jgi:uncharacterized membrane protein YhdT
MPTTLSEVAAMRVASIMAGLLAFTLTYMAIIFAIAWPVQIVIGWIGFPIDYGAAVMIVALASIGLNFLGVRQ